MAYTVDPPPLTPGQRVHFGAGLVSPPPLFRGWETKRNHVLECILKVYIG